MHARETRFIRALPPSRRRRTHPSRADASGLHTAAALRRLGLRRPPTGQRPRRLLARRRTPLPRGHDADLRRLGQAVPGKRLHRALEGGIEVPDDALVVAVAHPHTPTAVLALDAKIARCAARGVPEGETAAAAALDRYACHVGLSLRFQQKWAFI